MTTAEHPITRSELREELQHYATKADLAALKADFGKEIGRLEVKLERMMWTQLIAIITVGGLVIGVLRLLGD